MTVRRALALLICIAALALAAGSGSAGSAAPTSATAAARPNLTDLKSLAQLRRLFNRSAGVPRVIALVAPT